MTENESLFDRMFSYPSGLQGRIGAALMVRMNASVAADVVELLEIEPTDSILEIGFGPGVGIEYAAELASEGYVAGIDISELMVERARRRSKTAVDAGRVDLRRGSVDDLPFAERTFDAAFSINSLHAWPAQRAGLREIRRVLRPGGTIAIVLTKHAGSPDAPLEELLETTGFERVQTVEQVDADCVLGALPRL